MLLALNIGNTNVTFGGYDSAGQRVFASRFYSDSALSSDELVYKLVNMLALYHIQPRDVDAAILASVVPVLTSRMREALEKMTNAPLMEVGPGLKSGVRIRMDNPAQLGGELLCAAVGALQTHKPPLLVMNMDTAATLVAVDAEGSIVGGVILPSPALSLSALVRNTAQLPQIDMELPAKRFLGTNTTDCLHSGIVNGSALMLDGLFARCRATLHAPDAPVIATGTLPASMTVVWEGAPDALLRRYGRTPRGNLRATLLNMGMQEGAQYLIREYGLPLTEESYFSVMREVIAELYETVELKPGVRTMLAKLQAEGARMCICSNTWAEQCRTVLTRLGIAQYFSFIVEARGVLHKSHPEVFFECMSRLGGADPAACAVCEDAVYAAATAHKAGYYVIGIADRTSAADEPEMRRICSQFVPRWDALDWTRV